VISPLRALKWPKKYDLFGVQVSATTYEEATDAIIEAARAGVPATVSLHAAHAVVTASGDPALREAVNTFQIVASDGQPVRWALNLLHRTGLRDRVYGPELTLRLCRAAAEHGVPIYLYGSSPQVIESLKKNLVAKYPGLQVAGAESPPFRPLTPQEDDEMVRRINESGAGIVFVGLGCPKQDWFAYEHRDRINAVQVCVGAAFDFHAGNKKMAPPWMQRHGLEWLFRLCEEPRRLWRRYLVTNTIFASKLGVSLVGQMFKNVRKRIARAATRRSRHPADPTLGLRSAQPPTTPNLIPKNSPIQTHCKQVSIQPNLGDLSMKNEKNELIVVGGAGGFIGGHLVADLFRRGYTNVRAVDIKPYHQWFQLFDRAENIVADLAEKEQCYRACRGAAEVYNLACNMGGMGFIENNKALCMLSVLINTHLLMAARDSGVQRFFYSSSACVYNADKQKNEDVVPLREEDAYPAMAEDGYGWEKLFSERMCRHFREDFGLTTRVARFHNVYGPHGSWDGGREKAPAAMCRKVIHAKHTGDHHIEIWGDGKQTRSFMYIDDCLEGIYRIMHSNVLEPINLGSDELVTINGLVDIVEEIGDVRLERSYNLDAPKGVNGRNSDNTLIQKYLGWAPNIRLRDGMEKTYEWIREEYLAREAKAIYADADSAVVDS